MDSPNRAGTRLLIEGWPGVGLLKQFYPFRYFPHFSASPKYVLAIVYHVHIWQVLPQSSCGDTRQIWMWCKESRCFDRIENVTNGALVTATPGQQYHLLGNQNLCQRGMGSVGTQKYSSSTLFIVITLEGPEDRHLRNSICGGHVTSLTHQYLWLRPPWGLTGRAWLQAGAQQAGIAVDPSFTSLAIDSRNGCGMLGK